MKMKTMKFVLGAAALWAGAAIAQSSPTTPANATMPPGEFAQGEVRKVDKENNKVTLKHGDIPSLDMPPMSMVFIARDPALITRVKPGDKLRFRAASENGTLYLIEVK